MLSNLSAKYSVLFATDTVPANEVEELLINGTKVILFCADGCKRNLENALERFVNAGFLNLFQNKAGIKILVEDGRIDDEEVLRQLEIGDPSFNIEQYMIEHAPIDKNIIVEAGAGTGKTHVMVNRILFLMHMDPEFELSKVAMITFTNKAVDNMRHRLVETLELKYKLTCKEKYLEMIEDISGVTISTIHSFFRKVIVEVGPILGYGTNIQLKSYVQEKKELLKGLLDDIYAGNNIRVDNVIGLPLHDIQKLALGYWEKLDNNGLSEAELGGLAWGNTSSEKAGLIQKSLIDIFSRVDNEYNRIKYINNAISMKDIIHELSRVIEDSRIKEYIIEQYRYMFCDEFQDSDNVQIQTIAILNRIYDGRLFVVGDIKQSIYRFRGATDSAFLRLDEWFDDKEKSRVFRMSLRKNYRTSKEILNKINPIFERWGNSGRGLLSYDKCDGLIPQKDSNGTYHQISIDRNDRKAKVIATIRDIQSYSEHKGVTVLTRTNGQLRLIRKWCEDEKIICLIKEKGSFFNSEAVLDFCALIEYYLFYNEPKYLYNFIFSAYGTGIVDYEALKACDGDKEAVLKVLLEQIDVKKRDHFIQELRNKPIMVVLREIITEYAPSERYGIRRKMILVGKGFTEEQATEQARLEAKQYDANLKKLLQMIKNSFSGDFASLVDLCEYLRLMILTNNDRGEEQAEIKYYDKDIVVEGMTVHSAKGLEFDNVLLPFMNDPFNSEKHSEVLVSGDRERIGWVYRKDDIEIYNDQYKELLKEEKREVTKEETRLLYVAMTRAVYGLYCFPDRNYYNAEAPSTWADLLPQEIDNEKVL